MFLLFRPRVLVQEEPFDIKLTFFNLKKKFYGGTFKLLLRYPSGMGTVTEKIDIPSLGEHETWSTIIEDLVILESGLCGIRFHDQEYIKEDGNKISGNFLRFVYINGQYLGLRVASKEELYQKYSVIVALWASAISILISSLSLFFSLFK